MRSRMCHGSVPICGRYPDDRRGAHEENCWKNPQPWPVSHYPKGMQEAVRRRDAWEMQQRRDRGELPPDGRGQGDAGQRPACPGLASPLCQPGVPEAQRPILVRASSETCGRYCAAIVREAQKAANREPPKPIEIEAELPDYDAATQRGERLRRRVRPAVVRDDYPDTVDDVRELASFAPHHRAG